MRNPINREPCHFIAITEANFLFNVGSMRFDSLDAQIQILRD
jgi:hypothetical protein